MQDTITFYSTLREDVLKKVLFRGTLKAAFGGLLILLTALIFPPKTLADFGLFVYLLGIFLIAWGLLPYKRLQKLQIYPHKLVIDSQSLFVLLKGKNQIQIPLKEIHSLSYLNSSTHYGIFVEWGEKPIPQTTFLPYFNRHIFKELQEILDTSLD